MRRPRLKIIRQSACYHIVCRVTQGQLWLGLEEKTFLLELLPRVANYCGVEILTFCLMSNHFHLLVRVPEKSAADAALRPAHLIQRVQDLYGSEPADLLQSLFNGLNTGNTKLLWEEELALHLGRMHDLSIFMKLLKQRFTMWYNRRHDTKGTLWTERFKSVVIESRDEGSNPLHIVAAYIDLNPVRAGIVTAAVDYPFSGVGSAAVGNMESKQGLARITEPTSASSYQDLVDGISAADQSKSSALATFLQSRQAALVKGLVLGSATFVMEILSAMVDIRRGVRPQAYASGSTGGDLWVGQRFRK